MTTITIIQDDINKAWEEYSSDINYNICEHCVVFQALKRAGKTVHNVAYIEYRATQGGSKIPLFGDVYFVTKLTRSQWQQALGKQIIIP